MVERGRQAVGDGGQHRRRHTTSADYSEPSKGHFTPPAAPAGGPAKLSANDPIAIMSISIMRGPRDARASAKAESKSSIREMRACGNPIDWQTSEKSGVRMLE